MPATEENKAVLVDGKQDRQTLDLITAIYESTAFGKSVKLPLKADSPFYTKEGVLKNAPHFYGKITTVENFGDNTITT